MIEIYGADDVKTEYKEERYPYHCDVYIPSKDLFIELNLFFTHGGHPYSASRSQSSDSFCRSAQLRYCSRRIFP